ncbi:hypothetical protein HFC70_10865 [Agrobacterium sp. a22-2]|uniref:capsular polysaccharide export protein, LipB/KpsS family n=1 Tax=Agrobacterium sp. a22-2 TaxID=2283840 RepID=UPI00144512F1|nr:hypothetical protein [Agrobacterium sp. a22-2]NKN36854.1 hypothetical protein [Agrobacterium sp. a22-2]
MATTPLIDAGDVWIRRRDGLKAWLAFTPFSRLLGCSASFQDRAAREGVLLASLVMRVWRFMPSFMLDIAMIAEGAGDERSFRRLLGQAMTAAADLEARLGGRPAALDELVRFHIAIFDLNKAAVLAESGRLAGIDGADALCSEVKALEAECAPWRHAVEAARQDLIRRMQGAATDQRGNYLTVYVPGPAFRRNRRDYPGFRSDIRKVFRLIFADLDAAQTPYRVAARMAKHGALSGEGGPYIAYHSVGTSKQGLHVKETDRRSYFSVDTAGYSGWSDFSKRPLPAQPADRSVIESFVAGERRALIAGNQSKYEQPDQDPARPASPPHVFVALQVVDDAVQRLAHVHMFDMLEEVSLVCRARHIPVVVKRHPLCRSWEVASVLRRGERRGLFSVSPDSIHGLISNACAVCVVNSSVGAEALLHGKPVYTFGASEYQAATFQIRARGDFARVFEPDRLPASTEAIEALLYSLRTDYAANVRDDEGIRTFLSGRLSSLLAQSQND